jgi:hypothetical protein
LIIGSIIGYFCSWPWLFSWVTIWTIGEFVTIKKILHHSTLTNENLDLSPKLKGEISGQCLIAALAAGIGTLIIASSVKLIAGLLT